MTEALELSSFMEKVTAQAEEADAERDEELRRLDLQDWVGLPFGSLKCILFLVCVSTCS